MNRLSLTLLVRMIWLSDMGGINLAKAWVFFVLFGLFCVRSVEASDILMYEGDLYQVLESEEDPNIPPVEKPVLGQGCQVVYEPISGGAGLLRFEAFAMNTRSTTAAVIVPIRLTLDQLLSAANEGVSIPIYRHSPTVLNLIQTPGGFGIEEFREGEWSEDDYFAQRLYLEFSGTPFPLDRHNLRGTESIYLRADFEGARELNSGPFVCRTFLGV